MITGMTFYQTLPPDHAAVAMADAITAFLAPCVTESRSSAPLTKNIGKDAA